LTASIGVDVGGTKIAAALLAGGGRVLARTVVPTRAARPGGEVLSDAVAAASAMADEAASRGLTIGGVGVGVPEIVDLDGRVITGSVIDWTGEDVEAAFAGLGSVTIISDVRAAALAEAQLGAGRGHGVIVYITVGTGISHTLVVDGRPFPGARGAALLFGTGPIADVVLEDVASGPAIAAAAGAETAEEALASDHPAVDEAARLLGEGIAVLVNLLDPEIVVVGGGLGSAGGRYLDRAIEVARPRIWLPAARDLPIVTAGLGPEAGVVGAALASRFAL
jgi:glucokinase